MTERTSWYGKLPSTGDFASRRLGPQPLEALDAWLARGLAEWQARAPERWLAQFLAGPSWRFAWPAGTLAGVGAVAGVLMPSVDRVGRYFPLTLLHPLADPLSPAGLRWLHRLDDLALDAMDEDWSIDQLEAELERLDADAPAADDGAAPLLPALACWWRADAAHGLLWHRSAGLPQGEDFETLIAGHAGDPE